MFLSDRKPKGAGPADWVTRKRKAPEPESGKFDKRQVKDFHHLSVRSGTSRIKTARQSFRLNATLREALDLESLESSAVEPSVFTVASFNQADCSLGGRDDNKKPPSVERETSSSLVSTS